MANITNEQYPFGSATFEDDAWRLRKAGLSGDSGLFLGYKNRRPLRLDSDAPLITVGGAGSGKLRDLLAFNVCGIRAGNGTWCGPRRMLVNDPRGELAALSIHNQIRMGKHALCLNPFGLHGLPAHTVNPWDTIQSESVTAESDLKLAISDLITLTGSANAEYFEQRARGWSAALAKQHLSRHGNITLPAFYHLINDLEDPSGWAVFAEEMLGSDDAEIRRVAMEIDGKRHEAPKEYGAIMGEIYKSIGFLSDPAIRRCLAEDGKPDFSLSCLSERDCTVYLMIPAEYMSLLAPMQRAIIGSAMLHKQRRPDAPQVLFIIDEAAQLGRFEALLRAYSYGRGMGIRTWSIWQDLGQIERNFGYAALSGFLGSSQVRQFFGVRDLETARTISSMLGNETLEYSAELEQANARKTAKTILHGVLAGQDPVEAGLNYAYQRQAAVHRKKQARALMSPDEILSMPEDRQILFISGLDLHPIYAEKYPYFTKPEMAGGYLPNPYHPPLDCVPVAGRFRMRRARVIRERAPERFKDWPQFQDGTWSYIEGYRPKT